MTKDKSSGFPKRITIRTKEGKTRIFPIHICQSIEEFFDVSGPGVTEEEWELIKAALSKPAKPIKKSSRRAK